MNKTTGLGIARSIFEAADRISSGVTVACVVAALLKPTLGSGEDVMFSATVWGALFLLLTIVTSVCKAMLDSVIRKAENDGGDN